MGLTRRQFLKTGIFGGLLLAGLEVTHGILWGKPSLLLPQRQFLKVADQACLKKIIPVVLKGAWQPNLGISLEQLTAHIDFTIVHLSQRTQKEIRELFTLLEFAPTRWPVTSLPGWGEASEQDIETFLENWRTHRFALFRTAYSALIKLIMGAYYADPLAWEKIGYPGPPRLGVEM